jgi:hypothetical protein
LDRNCPNPGRIREANTIGVEIVAVLAGGSAFAMNDFIISELVYSTGDIENKEQESIPGSKD